MKRTTRKKRALAGWLLAGCTVQALAGQEVPVGRVDLQLPGEGWQVYSVEDKGVTLTGNGHSHRQTTETKVIVHHGSDHVLDAVFVVRANNSGKGIFSGVVFPDAECEGSAKVYAEGDKPGPSAQSFRCLQVAAWHPYAQSSGIPEDAMTWITQKGWLFPPDMFVMMAVQHANTGAFAEFLGYVRPVEKAPADADATAVPPSLPEGLNAASVQWSRQLQQAVTNSVYSIRGKLHVPVMVFAETGNGFPAKPVEAEAQNPVPPARVPAPGSGDRG